MAIQPLRQRLNALKVGVVWFCALALLTTQLLVTPVAAQSEPYVQGEDEVQFDEPTIPTGQTIGSLEEIEGVPIDSIPIITGSQRA